MASHREWTIAELASMLSDLPQDAKIKLRDADTNWTIYKFDIIFDDGVLWFDPSDYSEMKG